MSKIVIDPGHGGYDPGAIGNNGTKEKDVTLAVSKLLYDKLKKQNFEVIMTRYSDQVPWDSDSDLYERVRISNNFNADIFISIHTNAFSSSSAKGMEVWTSVGQTNSDKLADCIAKQMQNSFGNLVFRSDLSDGDLDKEANFYVLKNTNAIAVLVELAFITNLNEEKLLTDINQQNKFADSILKGICDYLQKEVIKEADKLMEQWKIDLGIKSVNELAQKGIILNPEDAIKELAEPVQYWKFFTLLNRIYKG